MKPEPRREFVARGTAYKDEASIPVTIVGGYRPLETDPVKCKVILELESCPWGLADINIGDIENHQHRIQLQGRTEFDEDIWIPRYRITTTSANEHQVSLEGVAEFFVEGSLAEFDASGGTIICSAYVPPTPIALANVVYMPSYDGTITIEQGKREGIRWNTDLGEAELTDNYTYYWDRVGIDRARVQVQQCQIEIRVQGTKDVSLRSFCERLPSVLDEPLWLLSFLSRKRVAWYRAQVVFYPGDGPTRNFREAVLRREQWLGYEYEQTQEVLELDLLVKVQALRDGLFERLCENYKASPLRDCIHRSIPYLLMSHGRSYIEPRIGIAYSALEGLVASLSEETEITYLLGASQFNKLSKKLRAFI